MAPTLLDTRKVGCSSPARMTEHEWRTPPGIYELNLMATFRSQRRHSRSNSSPPFPWARAFAFALICACDPFIAAAAADTMQSGGDASNCRRWRHCGEISVHYRTWSSGGLAPRVAVCWAFLFSLAVNSLWDFWSLTSIWFPSWHLAMWFEPAAGTAKWERQKMIG